MPLKRTLENVCRNQDIDALKKSHDARKAELAKTIDDAREAGRIPGQEPENERHPGRKR